MASLFSELQRVGISYEKKKLICIKIQILGFETLDPFFKEYLYILVATLFLYLRIFALLTFGDKG